MVYLAVIIVSVCALAFVGYNFFRLKKMEEGNDEMKEIAEIIRRGARTFMREEYKRIVPAILIVAVLISLFIEKTCGLTFILGATMSSLACIIGMRSATYANVRTANTAAKTKDIGRTTQTALRGGSISGLSVPAFGLFGLVLICIITGGVKNDATGTGFLANTVCNPSVMRFTTYSLGCSLVALFNRVAGGNYTKAADISADIVAKIRHDMPEDDSRMPNTIADFIGDNVNDIAGNCSDLLESFVATISACLLIAGTIAAEYNGSEEMFNATAIFPIIIAGAGLFGSLLSIAFALFHKATDKPSRELDLTTYISAGFVIVVSFAASKMLFSELQVYEVFKCGWASPWIASLLGIISGVAIGKITEYYTGTDFNPVKRLAQMATEGEAFVVTKGDAIGSRSCLLPIGTICLALVLSGILCGIYGIAVAALGMLSFVGTTVSIDAFGPIADNAGGIAESCHLGEDIRVITDKLDAVGNTTAAIGKGFAIGSAAFATVSLIFSYVGSYSEGLPDLNIAGYIVIAGAIFGAAIIEFFIAMLSDNTIDAAYKMADEGDRQLSIPGVLEGTVKPDYEKVISMAANLALKKMIAPSLVALIVPVIGGFLFGVEFVGGLLIGATIVAIPRAIFMGNSGGAFDNAKKYIESGMLEGHGKGSSAHKAAVAGDTIGDTRKDVVGVALDIAIKLMSTVAVTLVPLFLAFHIF
ncbi:K(+)-stimulated pyrophosphate-energized sodium pump [Ruminococcaceae bacterium KH2T8]|nr:K(+)-stimulated pyrophosphate-energized sodium pump [Ruminococcaceae bacterium KH2T8]